LELAAVIRVALGGDTAEHRFPPLRTEDLAPGSLSQLVAARTRIGFTARFCEIPGSPPVQKNIFVQICVSFRQACVTSDQAAG
jgi:hypothetical protein